MTLTRPLLLLSLGVSTLACSVDAPDGKAGGTTGTTGTTEVEDTDPPDEDPVPASLEVSVDAYTGDIGQVFTVTVRVLDDEGTEIPGVDTDLSVADPSVAELLGPQVTFLAEGIFVVTATLGDGSMATDSEPIRIDDNGPVINIASPSSGLWLEAATTTVTGTVVDALAGVDTVTISGEAVELADDGSFSHELTLVPGPNAIEVVATDIDGNAADAWIGLMTGAAADPEGTYEGMRVGIGTDGIVSIANPLLDELDSTVVEASIKAANPLVRGSISCVDYRADVLSVSYGSPSLTITPDDEYVHMDIDLTDLRIRVDVDVDICGINVSDVITITDTVTTISGDISLGYIPLYDAIFAAVLNGEVSYADLDVDYGTLASTLSSYGLSVSSLGIDVGSIIEEAILEVVEAEVPPPLVATLEAMQFVEQLDVLGSVVTLETKTTGVNVSPSGVEVELETLTTGPAPDPEMPELPGVLALGGAAPEVDASVELALSLSVDELNRILHLAHASGAFRIHLTDTDLGLDPALIDFVFPGATTLDLTFAPSLPPVLHPDEAAEALLLSMLSLELEARGLVEGVDTELVRGQVHVLGEVDAGINADGDMTIQIVSIVPVVDTVTPAADGVAAAEALEDQLASISSSIIGDLFPEIAFAIPEVEGMTLTTTGAGPAGEAGTWMKVDATVSE